MIINANMALNALTTIALENPDFVYADNYAQAENGCNYVVGRQPACGVGRALALLGMSVEQLYDMDVSLHPGISEAPLPDGWYLTTHARAIFSTFQSMQDNNNNWLDALRHTQYTYLHHYGY